MYVDNREWIQPGRDINLILLPRHEYQETCLTFSVDIIPPLYYLVRICLDL